MESEEYLLVLAERGHVLSYQGKTSMNIVYLNQGAPDYPAGLSKHLTDQTPPRIAALGNLNILKKKKIAFFCSSECPGDLIIKTYDLAKKWRDDGVTVIGGFHSPIEQECLTILLRGKQPVIVCPARSIEAMRIKTEFQAPLAEGRLLMLSPFPLKERRMTAQTALIRNRLVAALADEIFVAHAASGGKTDAFCRELISRDHQIVTFDHPASGNLIARGAQAVG